MEDNKETKEAALITRDVLERLGFKLYGSTFMYMLGIGRFERVIYNFDSKWLYVQRLFKDNKCAMVRVEYEDQLLRVLEENGIELSCLNAKD